MKYLCFRNNAVDKPVLNRFLGTHPKIAISIFLDLSKFLTSVFSENLIEPLLQEQPFAKCNLLISNLALRPTTWLVNHNTTIRKRKSLSFRATREKKCTHTRLQANPDSLYIWADKLNRVIDRKTIIHTSTGAIDIEFNIFFRIFVCEMDKLRNNNISCMLVNVFSKKNDALIKKP